MILELIQQVEDSLSSSMSIDTLREQRSRLNKSLDELKKLCDVLDSVAEMYSMYSERIQDGELLTSVEQRMAERREKLSEAILNSNEGRPFVKLQVIRDGCETDGRRLAEAWHKSVRESLPNKETSRLLSTIPELREDANYFEQTYDEIVAESQSLPASNEEIADLDRRIAELCTILDTLDAIPDNVRYFLGRVLSQEATLADLNMAGVWNWCSESQERLTAFKIRA
jgi:hypothetical protein